MDGDIAQLEGICELGERYEALVMIDDSHSTGYIGATGRGTPKYRGVEGRIDIITTTFGKCLGGASGGCASGRAEIIQWLRQKSRPYLFSNTLAPAIAGATVKVIDMLNHTTELRKKLLYHAGYFRQKMVDAGFNILPGETAIVPVMLYDENMEKKCRKCFLREEFISSGFLAPLFLWERIGSESSYPQLMKGRTSTERSTHSPRLVESSGYTAKGKGYTIRKYFGILLYFFIFIAGSPNRTYCAWHRPLDDDLNLRKCEMYMCPVTLFSLKWGTIFSGYQSGATKELI
jgi:hypothetical protein